jgi:hypothetical protein
MIKGTSILLFLLSPAIVTAETPKEALARLQAVGREGKDNEAASRAWKDVVQRGPAMLPALLEAMDSADAVSSNWLRTAGDAIVERALTEKKQLPAELLERFVAEKKHSGAARRLAYEWLCRMDKKTPDRLLPGMIQDPSPELRRDAVAAVIRTAEAQLAKGDKDAARVAFRTALTGACDKDQVDLLVGQLEKLGEKIDVAAHFGFVRQWRIIAPFDNRKESGFKKVYPPETGVDLQAVYKGQDEKETRWVAVSSKDPYGLVNLNKELGKQKGAVAYAYSVVDSPSERTIQLRAGSPNGLKIFVNGKEFFHREEYHHGAAVDQYVATAALKAGRNEILLKICQNEQTEEWAQDWKFQLRLCDAVGAAIPFTQSDLSAQNQ